MVSDFTPMPEYASRSPAGDHTPKFALPSFVTGFASLLSGRIVHKS